MQDLSVIDRFTEIFSRYIDSGFGLLTGEVAWLTGIVVAIDITLAGLFWSLGPESDVMARLIRKTLFVGSFALLLNNWQLLADIIFRSFAGLGLVASASNLAAADLLRPGFVANTGFAAAWPLLQQAGALISFTSFFDHFITIIVLVFAWFVVVLAFFILAVQLFVTIIEFKLTSLAGFVLVPFALWHRTAFLAERVLGNVVGAGVKMMVLAVIIGIGATLFEDFVQVLPDDAPALGQAMALMLAAIALFGLGIFAPSLAAGLTAGAPQLGAGAAVGTAGGIAAATMLAGGTALATARLAGGGLAALRAGSRIGGGAGGDASAHRGGGSTIGLGRPGPAGSGPGSTSSGGTSSGSTSSGSTGRKAGPAAGDKPRAGSPAAAGTLLDDHSGTDRPGGGTDPDGDSRAPGRADAPSRPRSTPPAWALALRAEQRRRANLLLFSQAIRDGDRPASPSSPDLKERS